jgi:hypothetical protein
MMEIEMDPMFSYNSSVSRVMKLRAAVHWLMLVDRDRCALYEFISCTSYKEGITTRFISHVTAFFFLSFFPSLLPPGAKHFLRILFWAKASFAFKIFRTFPISSSSTVLLHVLLEIFLSYTVPEGSN